MKRYIILTVILLLTTACSIQSDEEGVFTGDARLKQAEARATDTATDIEKQNAELDRQIRLSEMGAEREAHLVAVEATKVAYTTQMSTTLLQANAQVAAIVAQGDANANRIIASGQAEAESIRIQAASRANVTIALGNALSVAIYIFVVGLVMAMTILALGRATADVRGAVLASRYVRIGVESATLLPPPLVITEDGYLIDTRSGERARLRDAVGVDKLRLAATTHTTEIALLSAAEIQIAKQTKSDKAADALMGAASSVPMLAVNDDQGDNHDN